MAWNEAQGTWFNLGRKNFPDLATWKGLSAVKGAMRTGSIAKVDDAIVAAYQASTKPMMTDRSLGANQLFLACDAMLRGIGALDLQAKQRRAAVEELRSRAEAARDYYAAGAPTIQTILSRPNDIFQLLEARASDQLLVDRVFRNFVAYARTHWRYSANSNFSGEDLLAGTTTTIPCGGIANALKIVLQGVMKDGERVRFHTLPNYLLTKTKYTCFDPLVAGNVRDKTGGYDRSCLFREHYFLAWGGLYFDACMTAIYTGETDVIDFRPESVPGVRTVRVLAKPGATRSDSLYFLDKRTTAPGFNATWLRVPIQDARGVEALRSAVTPSVAEELKEHPEDAKVIADFCSKAG